MIADDDFETYLATYAREQQDRPFGSYDNCGRCGCDFHGLPCVKHVPIPGSSVTAPCMCPGDPR